MAQLLVRINDETQTVSSTQVIVIAKAVATQLEAIDEEDDSDTLANIATYVENNIEKFSDENNLSTLQVDINNPLKLAEMPMQPSVDVAALASLLTTAIATGVEETGDNSINLVLANVDFSSLIEEDFSEGSTYVLTQTKADSIWDAEIVASSSNSSFIVETLTFNQNATFEFELYAQKTITDDGGDSVYNSKPVVFNVDISAEQVANAAPTYNGSDSTEAVELLEALNVEAQDAYAFFDATPYGGDFTFSMGLRESDLNALFSDDSGGFLVESSDSDAFLFYNDSSELYFYGPSDVIVPSVGSFSVEYVLYAVDAQGVKSEQGFSYTLTVNSDSTATIVSGVNGDTGDSVEYGDEFYGIMFPTSYLATLETQAEDYLNQVSIDSEVLLEQVLAMYTYRCAVTNSCIQGDGYLGTYSLDDSTYLEIDSSEVGATVMQATGEVISGETIVKLIPSVNDETVRIYEVESRTSTDISDIDDFGNFIQLIITPDEGNGVNVVASIEK